MVTAIFPAAGRGSRMKAARNKILLELAGESILVQTLKRFARIDRISKMIIAVSKEEIPIIQNLLESKNFSKPIQIVEGGSERQFSIYNAIKKLSPESEIVLIHDAARPLVSTETIERVIDSAIEFGGSIAAVPEKNTIKIATSERFVDKTLPRNLLWEIQTPQAFRREIIEKAYESAISDKFLGTDDSSLVERIGYPVKIVESESSNIKITTPDDLLFAKEFIRRRDDGII
ncbi:MAG: 2-C-methyl-D-erythritol 4-phosphate cytidylyltransferase [Selenomonadaceae bacterium]|nr:2-C-methyl-D-erythritol 4-phosphate cytidylyltransferase [Selenomonadaceae bacterium]